MRPRTMKLQVDVKSFGMKMPPIATVTITPFKKRKQIPTSLHCPKCDSKPKYYQEYTCPNCNTKYSSWSKLIRKTKAGKKIERKKYTTDNKEVIAKVYILDKQEYLKYSDATVKEYGILVKDEQSIENIRKLLIASKNLGKVVLVTWWDTYEKVITILTTSATGRIILKEILPVNIARETDTMKINLEAINEEDIKETEQLVKIIPKATKDQLETDDYRTIGLDEIEEEEEKIIQLEKLLQVIKGKKKKRKKVKATQ